MPTFVFHCDRCGAEQSIRRSWDDGVPPPGFGCVCGGVFKREWKLRVKIPHHLKGTMHDYREDLARFPNDPQAFVDGPASLARLIDQRKREGAMIRPLSEAAADPNANRPHRNLAAEAYEAAKAKGFKYEGEE